MKLICSMFNSGEVIPVKYTCQGENISPPLEWQNVPSETQSLALIMDDPDSSNGPFSHWVLYGIPADKDSLPEGLEKAGQFEWGGMQGRNDFGSIGYGGPCPPKNMSHRYYIRLYALDSPCKLSAGATRAQLLDWIQKHTLESTEYMGSYASG